MANRWSAEAQTLLDKLFEARLIGSEDKPSKVQQEYGLFQLFPATVFQTHFNTTKKKFSDSKLSHFISCKSLQSPSFQ